MAVYVTNTSELTSIANAIRTKGGTSANLEYPNEFISAINAISTGSAIVITDEANATGITAVVTGDTSGNSGNNNGTMTIVTGTFTGDGTKTVQIPCNFEPREIYIEGDLEEDISLRGLEYFLLIKDNSYIILSDTSTSQSTTTLYNGNLNISGFNETNTSEAHASYSNNILTVSSVSGTGGQFASGITYNYKLVGFTQPTSHEIYLEFSDNTNTTIPVYYNDTAINTMITSYTPTTYNGKTVNLAQLDNVTWYERPTGTWQTLYNDTVGFYEDNDGTATYSYCWIEELGSIEITANSNWRVTLDNTEYLCTPIFDANVMSGTYVLGNPKYSQGTDNNSNIPFSLFQTPWGAWSGSIDGPNVDSTHTLKIERFVVT